MIQIHKYVYIYLLLNNCIISNSPIQTATKLLVHTSTTCLTGVPQVSLRTMRSSTLQTRMTFKMPSVFISRSSVTQTLKHHGPSPCSICLTTTPEPPQPIFTMTWWHPYHFTSAALTLGAPTRSGRWSRYLFETCQNRTQSTHQSPPKSK